MQVSLWLEFDPVCADRLGGYMRALRRALGGPEFSPHLTLLSGESDRDLDEWAARLAAVSNAPVLDLELQAVAFWGSHFRAVLLPMVASAELEALRVSLAALTGFDASVPFEPHVSLFYGDLAESAQSLVRAELANVAMACRATAVSAWDTTGPVEAWRRLAQVHLQR
jgi:2'-5' RNA ligase